MIPVLHGVWAAAGGLVSDFEHIETITVGAGGATSVTLSSIAGTYKHLQVRITGGVTTATNAFSVQFNNDTTGTNYRSHYLYGSGTNAVSTSDANILYPVVATGGALTTSPGSHIIDILDYASTTKNKTTRTLGGYDANGSGYVFLDSGLWMSTSAITSMKFNRAGTDVFLQNTTFSLYGIK